MHKVPTDRRAGLPPPQFRLSTLMLLMAVMGAIFALSGILGAYGTFWLVIFVLAALGHIAGNALGMRLREHGDRPLTPDEAGGEVGGSRSPAAVREIQFAPATRLRERSSLGLPLLLVTVSGVLSGGGVAAYWLLAFTTLSVPTVVVAVIAFSALGGIWTFLMYSFLAVFFGTLRHESVEKKRVI
jgi:hypothetical protein